jgi:hypothetical protein
MKLTTNAISWIEAGLRSDAEANEWLDEVRSAASLRHITAIDIIDEGRIDVWGLPSTHEVYAPVGCTPDFLLVRRRLDGTVPAQYLHAFVAVEDDAQCP